MSSFSRLPSRSVPSALAASPATAAASVGGSYEVVGNGVDLERLSGAEPWPVEGPTVLFVGRHEPRKGLEVLLEAGRPVSITTKSPLALRDIDLLRRFAAYGGVRVNMTVTVLDEQLWRLLEPMTPRPDARIAALRTLGDAGIPTSVFLAPVVPCIGEAEALAVLGVAKEARAGHAMVGLLRLSPGVREWLLPRLRAQLPEQTAELDRLYGRRDTIAQREATRILAPIRSLRRLSGLGRPPCALRPREELTVFGDPRDGPPGQRATQAD